MSSPFKNSIFHRILNDNQQVQNVPVSIMGGISGSRFASSQLLLDLPMVFFDFETTGLNSKTCRIIEIGAIKYQGQKEIARFSQLVYPKCKLSKEITQVTGITDEMLIGQPPIEKVLPLFHDFLRGCVGVAHNAEFDVGFLFHESNRLGIGCEYFILCSLKMARSLVKIEKRNLDALAKHYQLSFESRHRSIGDILVTAQVFWKILQEQPHLKTIGDLAPFKEPMPT